MISEHTTVNLSLGFYSCLYPTATLTCIIGVTKVVTYIYARHLAITIFLKAMSEFRWRLELVCFCCCIFPKHNVKISISLLIIG